MVGKAKETDPSFELRKFVAPEVVYGQGAFSLAGRYVTNLMAQNVFLVSDLGVRKVGLTDDLERMLVDSGLEFITYEDISANPKDHEVMKGAELYQENDCDVILALGGGSPMDCAKGIGVVVTNNKDVKEFEGVDMVETPGPPLVCIPTTAGTSADVSQFAIINDVAGRRKFAVISKTMVPDVSLIDPRTTVTLNKELTADTGMDALSHALEAFASTASSPLTDLHAMEAVRLIWNNLPLVIDRPDDLVLRNKVMLGSMMAGFAFSNASLGLVHAMAHSLEGFSGAAHGRCNAVLLEHAVEYNWPSASAKYARLIDIMSEGPVPVTGEGVDAFLEGLREFRRSLGIKGGLARTGLRKADIPALSRNALNDPCLATNPRRITVEEIGRLYERAL
ncbi:MAG TPA: alcohol dehydrogenase-like regulatory protein ErcA [Methanomassiliicoccales archaeon]|nr:alcohol dehydrogenase-like regulatory protein ErcA [Methanomassiliicoccales archaeon]